MLMTTFWNRLRYIERIIREKGESATSMTIREMAEELRYVYFCYSLWIFFKIKKLIIDHSRGKWAFVYVNAAERLACRFSRVKGKMMVLDAGSAGFWQAGKARRVRKALATVALRRDCDTVQKQLEIRTHHNVRVQFDAIWRTPSFDKEMVQSLERHTALRLWPLIDSCQDPA